jgi:hypothetical protein
MSGIFGGPKPPKPLPVVNPADTQNRLNDALARRLAPRAAATPTRPRPTTAPTGGARPRR